MGVDSFTREWVIRKRTSTSPDNTKSSTSSVIRIPVVVHVVYNSAAQNISDAQIRSQIDVLNQDYRRQNTDAENTPSFFRSVAADCEIEFVLATQDPLGNPSSGIVRKQTYIYGFNFDDRVKSTADGGDDPWNPDVYLNIWVANLSSGILGYSSLPGAPKETDGVTVQYTAFGTNGTAQAPFNRGRTATHEIGHWLNLIHVWGDMDCGDDRVDDTPPQKGPNRGCPGVERKTCANSIYGDMYMNFMDFTDDVCMNMFTTDQKLRMRSLFAEGGTRNAMLHSSAANAIANQPFAISQFDESPQTKIQIYPNPAADMVYVKLPDPVDLPVQMGIYNSLGQKMMSFTMQQKLQQVNLSRLGKGIYYLQSDNHSSKYLARLMKM
jgi:Pregnancy-associated plasma protein-A/Secretion system C-terminal sorting domain